MSEESKPEFPVIDRSNFKDFIKSGLALAAIVLWGVLTVEHIPPDSQPRDHNPMPAPPAALRD